jgi:hypothetical protein
MKVSIAIVGVVHCNMSLGINERLASCIYPFYSRLFSLFEIHQSPCSFGFPGCYRIVLAIRLDSLSSRRKPILHFLVLPTDLQTHNTSHLPH